MREFRIAFNLPAGERPELLTDDRAELNDDLIAEEFDELQSAWAAGDLVEVADALGDLAYVVYGAAIEYGIDLDRVIREIHRSNMTKLGEDGKPIYRSDGKVMKGPNYSPPDLSFITEES